MIELAGQIVAISELNEVELGCRIFLAIVGEPLPEGVRVRDVFEAMDLDAQLSDTTFVPGQPPQLGTMNLELQIAEPQLQQLFVRQTRPRQRLAAPFYRGTPKAGAAPSGEGRGHGCWRSDCKGSTVSLPNVRGAVCG